MTRPLSIGQDIVKRLTILNLEYKPKWKDFCNRWHIDSKWDGNINSLRTYINPPLMLYLVEDKKNGASTILLAIDNWTIINDIRDAWDKIEKYQNKIWKKQEKRANFMRDLCWYDLSEKCGMKPKQIAELWAEKFPEEIDLLVVRRIKKEIKKDELKGKVLTDSELLNEIRSGFLADEYRSYFQQEKKFYITGISTRGKFNPPFIDAVKKAIKRMKDQIMQIEISSLDPIMRIKERAFLNNYKIKRLTSA